ncbi:MAG: hypothetical protein ACFE0J_16015 [Elainellaceae cyanobacterium]
MPTLAQTSDAPPQPDSMSGAWSTVRFRRAKNAKAWALLGIPSQIYPIVTYRLFELRARFIDKYEDGQFISVLFEAPPALAARLALAFPAPPGCDTLSIAEGGDRILSGRAANSTKARRQALDPIDQSRNALGSS